MVIRRRSGRVVEESTVFVPRQVKPRRNKRRGTTTAQKRDENERDCVKKLARVLNANYSHGDLLLTAKYDEAGMAKLEKWAEGLMEDDPGLCREEAILAAAEREGELYARRLGRELKKQGVEVKRVLVTSDMDGETGEAARPHHHIVIQRVGFEVAARKWGLGTVDYQILRAQDDYTPLAAYLCRQVRRRPAQKKYSCSRNMDKPVVSERWAKPGEELRPDRGARVTGRNEWEPGKPQYIRFVVEKRGASEETASRGRREPQPPSDRAEAQRQRVRGGEEEQGSEAKFSPRVETEKSGLCDDEFLDTARRGGAGGGRARSSKAGNGHERE